MEKALKQIPKYHLLIFLSIAILLVFFDGVNESLFSEMITFFEENSNAIALQVSFVLFIGLSIWRLVTKVKSTERPNSTSYIIYALILFVYIFLFRNNDSWEYYPIFSNFFEGVKYADIIIIFSFSWIAVYIRGKTELDTNTYPKFVQDNHKEFDEKDLYNREDFAKKISEYIKGTSAHKAFAIGITGEWGYGKSIFTKYINEDLKKNNHIVIDFKPWAYRKDSDLVKAFLSQVEEEITPYSPILGRSIIKYSDSLSDFSDNSYIKMAKSVMDLFENDEAEEVAIQIAESITKLKRKIIVVIDDVDRLKPQEIFEVVKIVRSCFDFPNTFFLVAYDVTYLDEGLVSAINLKHKGRYAEKIFQVEFSLPAFPKSVLISAFKHKILTRADERENILIETAINEMISVQTNRVWEVSGINILDEYLENLRDVIRLTNQLNIIFSCVPPDEYNIKHIITLTVLQIKYPVVYQLLKNKQLISIP